MLVLSVALALVLEQESAATDPLQDNNTVVDKHSSPQPLTPLAESSRPSFAAASMCSTVHAPDRRMAAHARPQQLQYTMLHSIRLIVRRKPMLPYRDVLQCTGSTGIVLQSQ